ncbi:MAG: UDP-glucose/GDP-mannose dehydrogenase family protein [Candidatus Sericytochromatia bacterium]|nr:UDP-glucose/GDP-mannose dehydrogenase family protein [Candidatus Sericytochromatia bacterium]
MRICVVGTGYVGLVTGACLAHVGHHVVCVDRDAAKIEGLNRGVLPIFEPGLPDMVSAQRAAGRLAFSTELAGAVARAEVVFITVGTPPAPGGEADLGSVEAVARAIGAALDGYKVIVNKSTVPVGCGDWVAMLVHEGLAARRGARLPAGGGGGGADLSAGAGSETEEPPTFDVVSCPEFLREGSAIHDTFHGDRIVVGSASSRAIAVMRELYTPLVEQRFAGGDPQRPIPFVVTDLGSAEMIKYAANCFLATKVSFINEIANVCERVGADVTQVAAGIGLDHRIGRHFLNAGIGWGGSCFPKDVRALTHIARDYGHEARLLQAVIEVNEAQRQVALVKLQQHLKSLKGKTVGLLGLAFKPDTDDLREAPAMGLARQLLKLGAGVRAYDPIASSRAQAELPALRTCDDPYVLAEGCDALVVATEWPEFRALDLGRMRLAMRGHHVFIDGRNMFEPAVLKELGFVYVGVGR